MIQSLIDDLNKLTPIQIAFFFLSMGWCFYSFLKFLKTVKEDEPIIKKYKTYVEEDQLN